MAGALDELVLRPAVVGDAEQLAAILIEGFETYRDFAPPSWHGPPELGWIASELARRLALPSVWGMVGENPSGLAGYVTLLPASESRRPVDDPALMHFWMLFVRSPWWGSGLATRLHTEACAAAATRGFAALRLFTPARQARARRFYEREGWTVSEPPCIDPDLGLEIVEYRRALAPPPG